MGTIADTARAVVDVLRARVGGRCRGDHQFRPFPAARARRGARETPGVAVVERTDEPAAADNPLTRETKAALYARAADGRCRGWSRSPLDSDPATSTLPTWQASSTGRGVQRATAVRRRRHPPSTGRAPRSIDISPAGSFACAATRSAAWVDHHEQAARDRHGRGLRQARPGVPALWVGEEGPPDELFADHRRRTDPGHGELTAGRPRVAP